MDLNVRLPAVPHEHEATMYYYGVGGTLLVRTSSHSYPHVHPSWAERKRFWIIGEHPLMHLWSDELVRQLQLALKGIKWDRFYPIRIGPTVSSLAEEPTDTLDHPKPVTLMVDVSPRSCDWEPAAYAVMWCRAVLRDVGVQDVEVEVREVARVPYAMDVGLEKMLAESGGYWTAPLPRELTAVTPEALSPLLSNIGYEISPADELRMAGTMGVHVRLSGRPSEAYGITSRHVAHAMVKDESDKKRDPFWLPNDLGYVLEDHATETHHHIVQPAWAKLLDMKRTIEEEAAGVEATLAKLRQNKAMSEVDPSRWPFDPLHDQRRLEDLERAISLARKVVSVIGDEGSKEATARQVGHVEYMPPLKRSPRGFWQDWALVHLDKSKFPGGAPANQVYIGPVGFADLSRGTREEVPLPERLTLQDRCDGGGFLRLQGTVPKGRILERKAFPVGKRGAASGLTFGMANEVKAVVRAPIGDGNTVICWEWIIVGMSLDGALRPDPRPFSRRGDSGAAVFDLNGDVVGILGSGIEESSERKEVRAWKVRTVEDDTLPLEAEIKKPESESVAGFHHYSKTTDLTFVTPIDVVFDDIEQGTGCTVEVL